MKVSILFLSFFFSFNCFSQENQFVGNWTSIYEYYSCEKTDDGYLFSGANPHEAGYQFFVQYDKTDKKYVVSDNIKYPKTADICDYGYSIEKIELENKEYILIRDSKLLIKDILKNLEDSEYLEFYSILKAKIELSGKYSTIDSQIITFSADRLSVNGLFDDTTYYFGSEFDFPKNVLIFKSDTLIYERHVDTLVLYQAFYDETSDSFKSKAKYKQLLKFGQSGIPYKSGLSGKYPIASIELLTNWELNRFNKKELKIMRNEIFARHGYKFKTDKMNTYFNSQFWYQKRHDDVKDLLTDIEKINIKRIKVFEEK